MQARLLLAAFLVVGCAGPDSSNPRSDRPGESLSSTPSLTRDPATPRGERKSTRKDGEPGEKPVVVEYMLIRRVHDRATAGFSRVAQATLEDARGWERADFDLVRKPRARYRIVLAEGATVDRLCRPYDTRGLYSCQIGPVVALNADRWRTATPEWTGTLAGYREMLVNHEFGHLLGQHHPEIQCPDPGHPAPVMAQQSTELNGCLPNPWPLPHEVKRAARHDLPLAPPYEE